MNLLNKLKLVTGFKKEKEKNENEINHYKVLPNDSLDVIFAKTLIQNNGNFFYCDNKNDLIKTLQALTKNANIEMLYCTENILQELLHKCNLDFSPKNNNCDAILSSCEYLIAHQGKVMLSSKQLGANNIKNLPQHHIIIAYTSQIVKSLNEGMSGINMRYIDNLPSTITTIKSSKKNNKDSFDGNIKKLSILLIEDFQNEK